MNTPTILAPGAICSCRADRVVRYVIPRIPGNPGEVSCRTAGSVLHSDVHNHALPARAIIAVHVPGIKESTNAKR